MPKVHPPAKYLTRLRWTIADARAALAALQESGLSLQAFAAGEGIEAQRLSRWRRRLASETLAGGATPEFVELRPRAADLVEVVLRTGHVLRVSESIEPSLLIRLVAALERTDPC